MSSTGNQTGAWFQTTSWSMVLSARSSRAQMEPLLRAYWSPVYAYIRKKGYGTHDAADLTQEFLTEVLLARDLIGKADRERGRFRSFLKSALRNFLIDQHRRAESRKASPKEGLISIEAAPVLAEARAEREPESAFDRQWAAAVLAVSIERVESACLEEGLIKQWEAFRLNVLVPLKGGVEPLTMPELAQRIGAADAAQASNMLQTVKRRFRRTLQQVVAETVSDPELVEQELAELRAFFGG